VPQSSLASTFAVTDAPRGIAYESALFGTTSYGLARDSDLAFRRDEWPMSANGARATTCIAAKSGTHATVIAWNVISRPTKCVSGVMGITPSHAAVVGRR
jgi:hypothetical protein